ncbi:MAG: hypothetical protein ACKV19_20270 [Verrucomicrobiales bacterium]
MNRSVFLCPLAGGTLGPARAAAEPAAAAGGAAAAPEGAPAGLQIHLVSVLVRDQAAALTFYTETLTSVGTEHSANRPSQVVNGR